MLSWATKRRIFYAAVVIIPLFAVLVAVLFLFFYEKPSCFDGRKNGDETGRDCGGSCILLCPQEAIAPVVLWARAFQVTGGTYNLVALVENPNIASESRQANYVFRVYDSNNTLITERRGRTSIPERQTFAVFESGISAGEAVPARTVFAFEEPIVWERAADAFAQIRTSNITLLNPTSTPRLNAAITNDNLQTLENIEVVAIVFDHNHNAIQASKTFVESLPTESSRPVVFTWPEPFNAGVKSCAQPVDIALVIDRSGSMNDDSLDPPEPLSSVKNAAKSFTGELSNRDQMALVSFATEASMPIDQTLTMNKTALLQAIDKITIGPNENTQHTNIFDGLQKAILELGSERNNLSAQDVIVLLTDGIASRPQENPEAEALRVAAGAKESGTALYTIGLGASVSEEFLRNLATSPAHYFFAPTKEDLNDVYTTIATAICERGPNAVELYPRVISR